MRKQKKTKKNKKKNKKQKKTKKKTKKQKKTKNKLVPWVIYNYDINYFVLNK